MVCRGKVFSTELFPEQLNSKQRKTLYKPFGVFCLQNVHRTFLAATFVVVSHLLTGTQLRVRNHCLPFCVFFGTIPIDVLSTLAPTDSGYRASQASAALQHQP